jgi:hypothetical protein
MVYWFKLGGFPMWITLVFGLMAIAAAARYARVPEKRWLPLVLSLGGMTFVSGAFGFVTGLIATFQTIEGIEPERRWLWMVGFGESLVNVAFALLLMALATLLVIAGAWRIAHGYAPPPRGPRSVA